MRRILLLTIFCSFALCMRAQTVPDCGGEDQRACSPADKEFWQTDSLACEYDLKLQTHLFHDDTCVNSQRWTLDKDYSWVGWALGEQRYNIGADLPINFITHLGTHNSYSSYQQGFVNVLSADQYYSITDQLQAGARLIRLDPWWYYDELRLCHADSVGQCKVSSPGRLFAGAIREIGSWLDANPGEVIIIRIHDSQDLSDHKDYINDPIKQYLASKVYTKSIDSGFAGRWPTMRELRNLGLQVIIFSSSDYGAGWTFSKSQYFLEDGTDGSLLSGCSNPSTSAVVNRDYAKWVLTSEDRSMSNSADPDLMKVFGTSSTYPPLNESQVTAATGCSFSNIELDFWLRLNDAYSDSYSHYSRGGPDLRREASIWSWQEDDYGKRGPALLDVPTGRWRSLAAANDYPYLCMKPDAGTYISGIPDYGNPSKAVWRVTSFAGAWNLDNGNSECAKEFGAGYLFSFPRNGYQNAQAVTAARGLQGVWLGYSTFEIPEPSAGPPNIRFTMQRGGAIPDAVSVKVVGTVGDPPNTFSTKFTSGAQYFAVSAPDNKLQLAGTPITVSVSSIAPTLPVGLYEGSIQLFESGKTTGGGVVSVVLEVDEPTTTTITANPSTMFELTPTVITATVLGHPLSALQDSITGTVVLQETVTDPQTSRTTVQELGRGYLASSDVNTSGANNQVQFPLTLSPGSHSLVANYSGDSHYSPSDSSVLTISPVPLVRVTPSTVNFSISQSSQMAGPWTLNATSTLPVGPVLGTWSIPQGTGRDPIYLHVSPTGTNSSSATVTLDSQAFSSLGPGQYDLNVEFQRSDKKPAPEDTHFSMRVLGALSASASQTTLTNDALTHSVSVTGSGPMQITVNTNQTPWLTATVASLATPTAVVFTANPAGMVPGDYTANVTIGSPFSANSIPVSVKLHLLGASTVTTNVPNGSVLVDRLPYSTPATFYWEPGSHHNVIAASLQTPDTTSRWHFQNWSDGGVPEHAVIVPSTAGAVLNLTATYSPDYLLAVSPAPPAGGTVMLNPASADGFYAAATPVSITAQPSAGYQFLGFTGGVTGSLNPSTVVMSGPQSVGAVFSLAPPKTVDVTIATLPAGLVVTVDGAPMPGGTALHWQQGSTHTINAPLTQHEVMQDRLAFAQWSDGGAASHSFTVSGGQVLTLTATYRKQHLLSTMAQPSSGGTVSGGGWYDENSSATITATPAKGYVFSSFSGAPQASVNPQTITVSTGLLIQANFALQPPNLFASPGPRSDIPDGERSVTIVLTNSGGPADNARIDSITNVKVMSGSGDVHTTGIFPGGGVTIVPGGNFSFTTLWNWPATATRVQFTVNFSTQAGYHGSTVLTMFR